MALVIKGGKISGKILAWAMKKSLKIGKNSVKKLTTTKSMDGKGQQTVKQLTKQGAGVSSIEISEKNIKSFEGVARKYWVDFALKKDTTVKPPNYIVFFKGRDTDAITAAFKEYSAKELSRGKSNSKKSVLGTLKALMAKVKNQVVDQTKQKTKGNELLQNL